mgnify:CR=1 FL=1
MNMQAMLKQAQKLQKEMLETQEKINNKEFIKCFEESPKDLLKEAVAEIKDLEGNSKNNVKISKKMLPYTFTRLDTLNLYNPLTDKASFSKQFKDVKYLKDEQVIELTIENKKIGYIYISVFDT